MSRWIVVLLLSLMLPCAACAMLDPTPAEASAGVLTETADALADTDPSTDPDLFNDARDSHAGPPAGAAPPRFCAVQLARPYLEVLGRPPRHTGRVC
jgi:hypothetical protein